MSTAQQRPGGRGPAFARRHPIAAFLTVVLALGWILLTIPNLTRLPQAPFLIVLNLVLLAAALLLTRWTDGPGAAGRLLARVARWRFSPWRYAVILLGMPAATIGVAAAIGTANIPDNWLAFGLTYLFQTIVFGALLLNLWEETAWTGFLQSRLMDRHGLLIGSLLTAPWFLAVHIPLSFAPGWTWANAVANLALLIVIAPVMRYLLGMHYLDTGASVLAVGLQHAAFNASADLGHAGWEYAAGLVVLTALVAAARHLARRRTRSRAAKPGQATP
jgi:membrane protease YdiL (CAAX protease family)